MLKITQTNGQGGRPTVKLEGKLLEPWVDEVRALFVSPGAESLPRLDLPSVTFVDGAGADLLRQLLRQGVAIESCSPFVAALLHLNGKPKRLIGVLMETETARNTDATLSTVSEDADLLAALRHEDSTAYQEFVRRFGGQMLATARRFLHREEDCADAVQEAFLSAFQALDKFEGNSKLGTWLHRIVVNACLMKIRARARRSEVSIEGLLPTFDESGHHASGVRRWKQVARRTTFARGDSIAGPPLHRHASRRLPHGSAAP